MGSSDSTSSIVTLPSGLVVHELRVGQGATAELGDRCSVAFTGWLKGQSQPFDGTTGDDEPFMFSLRKGEIILGYPGETRETLKQTFGFLIDECGVLSHHNIEMCPQLYLPLQGTRAFQETATYAERHGYRPSSPDWWNRDAQDRFAGLRPSRGLSADACSGLAQLFAVYHRGAGDDEKAGDPNAKNVCAIFNHSKFEQREFRDKLMRMIESSST